VIEEAYQVRPCNIEFKTRTVHWSKKYQPQSAHHQTSPHMFIERSKHIHRGKCIHTAPTSVRSEQSKQKKKKKKKKIPSFPCVVVEAAAPFECACSENVSWPLPVYVTISECDSRDLLPSSLTAKAASQSESAVHVLAGCCCLLLLLLFEEEQEQIAILLSYLTPTVRCCLLSLYSVSFLSTVVLVHP
jgi:hypothetical protein